MIPRWTPQRRAEEVGASGGPNGAKQEQLKMGIQAKKAILESKLHLQTAKELEDYKAFHRNQGEAPPISNGQAEYSSMGSLSSVFSAKLCLGVPAPLKGSRCSAL